ncbi:MAG: hypothetical protein E1N59_1094 [Puniceicoccaceae bacterium 5H]|nr:MAG: hypothetical protein E1N59_1094 [Puniceicoccaceae bacterium 5H]
MAGPKPIDIQLIGEEVAIKWSDEREDYIPMERLRAWSPSAENVGEPDIFGRIHGADPRDAFPGVRVDGFEFVGTYAVRFIFSDRHQSGLYSYEYLRRLGEYAAENAT